MPPGQELTEEQRLKQAVMSSHTVTSGAQGVQGPMSPMQPIPPGGVQPGMNGSPMQGQVGFESDPSVGFGVASIVLAFIFTPLGLIFGLIGVSKGADFNRRTGRASSGRTLSVVGVVLSIVNTLLFIGAIVLLVVVAANVVDTNPSQLMGRWGCTDEIADGEYVMLDYGRGMVRFEQGSIFSYDFDDINMARNGTFMAFFGELDRDMREVEREMRRAKPGIGEFESLHVVQLSHRGRGSEEWTWMTFRTRDGVYNAAVTNNETMMMRYCQRGAGGFEERGAWLPFLRAR